ncbi:MAG: RHS repeat protein [Phycisphaerae bacterium]|nr:RHS repeat protein [Phycisphaerae bacterium]
MKPANRAVRGSWTIQVCATLCAVTAVAAFAERVSAGPCYGDACDPECANQCNFDDYPPECDPPIDEVGDDVDDMEMGVNSVKHPEHFPHTAGNLVRQMHGLRGASVSKPNPPAAGNAPQAMSRPRKMGRPTVRPSYRRAGQDVGSMVFDDGGGGDAGDGLYMSLTSGNVWTRVPVVATLSEGSPELNFSLRYDSQRGVQNGMVGFGWTHSYNIRVEEINYPRHPKVVIYWDGSGRRNAFVWDDQASEFTPPPGRSYGLTWVTDHYEITLPNGTVLVFNQSGRLVRKTDSRGRITRLTYNAGTQLTAITGPYGRQITLTYDTNGRVSTIVDPNDQATTLTYTNGDLTQITDPLQNTVQYAYDTLHRVTTETFGNSTHYHAEYTDGGTTQTHTIKDSDNNVVVSVQASSSVGLPARRDTLIAAGAITVTDGLGQSWVVLRDSKGRMTSITTPVHGDNLREVYTYEYGGVDDGFGRDRLVRRYDRSSQSMETAHQTSFSYDSDGNIVAVTDAVPNIEYRQYNHTIRSLLTKRIEPDNDEWEMTYDSYGRLTSLKDPLIESPDKQITLSYVNYGDTEGLPSGSATQPGRIKILTLTDRNGHVTRREYDARGNLAKVTRDYGTLNLITEYTFDDMGRPLTETVSRGDTSYPTNTTQWTYDARGRILTTTRDPGTGTHLRASAHR